MVNEIEGGIRPVKRIDPLFSSHLLSQPFLEIFLHPHGWPVLSLGQPIVPLHRLPAVLSRHSPLPFPFVHPFFGSGYISHPAHLLLAGQAQTEIGFTFHKVILAVVPEGYIHLTVFGFGRPLFESLAEAAVYLPF